MFNATLNNSSVIFRGSVFTLLLINALLYPYRVDGIKQTYKHGYIYIYTKMNILINHTLKQT